MLENVRRTLGRGLLTTVLASAWCALALLLLMLVRRTSVAVGLAPFLALLLLRWKSIYREIFALSISGFYVLLLTFEIVLRLRFFGLAALTHPMRYSPYGGVEENGLVIPVDDPRRVYDLRPGYRGRFMGKPILVNSIGCRGGDIESRTPNHTLVLTFGTSITFGAGVAESDTYPAVLGRYLGIEHQVEVVNCGVPAQPLALTFNRASDFATRFHPDVVTVELSASSLFDTEDVSRVAKVLGPGAPPQPPISAIERFSFVVGALYPPSSLRTRLEGVVHRRAEAAAAGPPSTRYLEQRLADLAEQGRREHFRTVLVLMRGMSPFDQPLSDQAVRVHVTQVAHAHGLEVLDTASLFAPTEFADDFLVFPGDMHPNALAHERIGAALAAALLSK